MKKVISLLPIIGLLFNFRFQTAKEVSDYLGWTVPQVNMWANYQIIVTVIAFLYLMTIV